MPLSGGSSSSGVALVKVDVPNMTINGNILTASASVDIATHITFTQTTAGITGTLLNPTITTVNKNIILQNLSTSTQVISITCVGGDSFSIGVGQSSEVTWNGSAWRLLNPAQVIPDYVEVRLNASTSTNLTASDHIKFDTILRQIGTSITPDVSTGYTNAANTNSLGRFLLQPNKIYELEGDCGDIGGAASYINYRWFNADTGVELALGTGGASIMGANLSNTNAVRGMAITTFAPTVATRVELRIQTISGITSYGGGFATNLATARIRVISGFTPVSGQVSGSGNVILAQQNFTTNTFVPATLGTYAIPSAGIWKLRYDINTDGTGVTLTNTMFAILNNVGVVQAGSEKSRGGGVTVAQVLTAEIIVTTTGATNYFLNGRAGAASGSASIINSVTAGQSTITWEQIGTTATVINTRSVVIANNISGQSIPTGATTVITGWTITKDSLSSFSTAGVFTAPKTADYMVTLGIGYTFTATTAGIATAEITGTVAKGGVISYLTGAVDATPQVSTLVTLTQGQTINVATFQNSGAARTLNAGASRCWLSIVEVNPTY